MARWPLEPLGCGRTQTSWALASRPRRSTSSGRTEIVFATSQIDGCNPIAPSLGIGHTHHVDPIPMALSLDGDFIPVFVSRTLARANVRMKKSSDSGRHVSKGWSESVAFAVLNV